VPTESYLSFHNTDKLNVKYVISVFKISIQTFYDTVKYSLTTARNSYLSYAPNKAPVAGFA
jgi:hypothetical protein